MHCCVLLSLASLSASISSLNALLMAACRPTLESSLRRGFLGCEGGRWLTASRRGSVETAAATAETSAAEISTCGLDVDWIARSSRLGFGLWEGGREGGKKEECHSNRFGRFAASPPGCSSVFLLLSCLYFRFSQKSALYPNRPISIQRPLLFFLLLNRTVFLSRLTRIRTNQVSSSPPARP